MKCVASGSGGVSVSRNGAAHESLHQWERAAKLAGAFAVVTQTVAEWCITSNKRWCGVAGVDERWNCSPHIDGDVEHEQPTV